MNVFPTRLGRLIRDEQADIVHLHLLSKETMSIAQVGRIKRPVVWTFHDMWAFCGTEHYAPDRAAHRYREGYEQTDAVDGDTGWDLDRWVWNRKKRHWRPENITVVTPSRWMGDCARSSALFKAARVEVIPNGIDPLVFKPIDRRFARDVLNLPQDKPLILFGAMKATSDTRKGFHLLDEALRMIYDQLDPSSVAPELVVFGASKSEEDTDFPLESHYTGRIHDEVGLCLLYAAADVFVAPSRQDNLPNTLVESLACGTPCVAFDIGGMPDMIEHRENGYLARPFDVVDLAHGIRWVLEDPSRRLKLSDRARQKVESEFTVQLQVDRCKALYQELLDVDRLEKVFAPSTVNNR